MKNADVICVESRLPFPDVIINNTAKKSYIRSEFLGMGSFGRCFLVKEPTSGKSFATKIVEKTILKHPVHSYFLAEELSVHRLLRHKNVVQFYDSFEDKNFIYLILELCSNGTLMELQKRRQCLTLIEAKYYVYHIINGVHYLHKKHIVHGDLKLSNIFINNRMVVKIGDFGLATALSYEGEQIKIQCGTPNYMAPEIVERKGHSYAGDVWAIGCILYGLLVGKLPFQSYENQLIYNKITNCDFSVYVPGLRKSVSHFIRKILTKEPKIRPSITNLKNDKFMTGFIPLTLPEYTLWEPPKPKDLIRGRTILRFIPYKNKNKSSTKRRKRMKPYLSRFRYITQREIIGV